MDDLQAIQLQISELQQKAAALVQSKKAEVLADIRAKIKMYGLTTKDLGLTGTTHGSTVSIKYRLGDLTWTGRGKRPRFIVEHLNNGGDLQDLLIKE
jgi:DNA-binding protein H-NS